MALLLRDRRKDPLSPGRILLVMGLALGIGLIRAQTPTRLLGGNQRLLEPSVTKLPASTTETISPVTTSSAVPTPTDKRLEWLRGEWRGDFQGKRELSVKDDGSGRMISYPEGIAATLLASKLTFEIQWKLNGDALEFETISGTPATATSVVLKMYGKKRVHKIVELAPDSMILRDEDGVTRYVWKRP